METQPPVRLSNPFRDAPSHTKVTVALSDEVYNYIFRHLLSGPKGPCQALMGTFFHKLYIHLHDELQIPGVYDPDNFETVAKVMSFLNFNDPSLRPNVPGQPDLSPSKPKKKRPASKHEPGATP